MLVAVVLGLGLLKVAALVAASAAQARIAQNRVVTITTTPRATIPWVTLIVDPERAGTDITYEWMFEPLEESVDVPFRIEFTSILSIEIFDGDVVHRFDEVALIGAGTKERLQITITPGPQVNGKAADAVVDAE